MAAIPRSIRMSIVRFNLTSSLLLQLRELLSCAPGAVRRYKKNTVDIRAFGRKWKGKTDPWIRSCIEADRDVHTPKDKDLLYRNA